MFSFYQLQPILLQRYLCACVVPGEQVADAAPYIVVEYEEVVFVHSKGQAINALTHGAEDAVPFDVRMLQRVGNDFTNFPVIFSRFFARTNAKLHETSDLYPESSRYESRTGYCVHIS